MISVVVLVLLVPTRVSTLSAVDEKCFPLGLNPRSRSRSRRRWFVLDPTSPRSGDTAVRAFRDPHQLMVIRAHFAPGPSYLRYSSQLKTYIWRHVGIRRAGATVLYGIHYRNSHLCCLATSCFSLANSSLGIEIASFNFCNSYRRLALYSWGVGGSERQSSTRSKSRSNPFTLLKVASFSYVRSSLIFSRRWASTVLVTIASICLRFFSRSDSKSTASTSSCVYPFFIMSVRNVAILLTFVGGASRPSWRPFHSCTRRLQRRSWCLFSSGRSCARSSHSSSSLSGDSSPFGGIPNSSALLIPSYIKEHAVSQGPWLEDRQDSCRPSQHAWPCETASYIYDGTSKVEEFGIPPRGEESPLGEELEWLDRAQERPDEKRDIRNGAEDAEYRSGSDAKKGERLFLRKWVKWRVPHWYDGKGVRTGWSIHYTLRIGAREEA